VSVNGALIVLMIFIVALCTHFRDVNTELDRLTALLMKRHSKVAGRFNSREEDMWILQRNITALRRKKKAIQKSNKDIEREAEDEFMKTLLLMEATLKAENEELLERKAQLQEAIKKEAELIDQYKVSERGRHRGRPCKCVGILLILGGDEEISQEKCEISICQRRRIGTFCKQSP
jgi:hypothetical protein